MAASQTIHSMYCEDDYIFQRENFNYLIVFHSCVPCFSRKFVFYCKFRCCASSVGRMQGFHLLSKLKGIWGKAGRYPKWRGPEAWASRGVRGSSWKFWKIWLPGMHFPAFWKRNYPFLIAPHLPSLQQKISFCSPRICSFNLLLC